MIDLTAENESIAGRDEVVHHLELVEDDTPCLDECLLLLERLKSACSRTDVANVAGYIMGQLEAAIIVAVAENDDVLNSLRNQVAAVERQKKLIDLSS